jgi:hypothetical protein
MPVVCTADFGFFTAFFTALLQTFWTLVCALFGSGFLVFFAGAFAVRATFATRLLALLGAARFFGAVGAGTASGAIAAASPRNIICLSVLSASGSCVGMTAGDCLAHYARHGFTSLAEGAKVTFHIVPNRGKESAEICG